MDNMTHVKIKPRLRAAVWRAMEAVGLAVALAAPLAAAAADPPRRPNIVIIVADDMGYADMGSFTPGTSGSNGMR